MPRYVTIILQAWSERLRRRRRQVNLRAGQRRVPVLRLLAGSAAPVPVPVPLLRRIGWGIAAAVCAVLAGGALIAGHARHLAAAIDEVAAATPQARQQLRAAHAYQAVLPGALFTVPVQPGLSTSAQAGGMVLVAAGMHAAPAVRVDLCSQMRSATDARLVPLRLGYRFEDVRRWVQRQSPAQPGALRNVLLVAERADGLEGVPEITIAGTARADFADPLSEPLAVSWRSVQGPARWISDASFGQLEQGVSAHVALRQHGWLLWGSGSALRLERRPNAMCPQAGELLVQMYRLPLPASASASASAADDAKALVVVFPARGRAVTSTLAPGTYQVPASAPVALEDQSLFEALQQHGLLRLTTSGAIETAPRDLPQWQAASATERAVTLAHWPESKPGAAERKLLKRLYAQADGAYVRQQIDIYNNERRLLAWRVKAPGQDWQVSAGSLDSAANVVQGDSASVLVATTSDMPVAASRLFATLPLGWLPWTRVSHWPTAADSVGGQPTVQLNLALPSAAQGGEMIQMLVVGRVTGAVGASMQLVPACTGRACTAPSDVQQLALTLQAGARAVHISVRALDFHAPEDQNYRHLRLHDGRLVWQALAPATAEGAARVGAGMLRTPAPVLLEDRNGTLLWADGAPTQPAIDAGLAPLLGVGNEHGNSVAGMLARMPLSPETVAPGPYTSNAAVAARLTLDLPLQHLSQQVLDCIGMRGGRWDGVGCRGAQAVPAGRHAGLVIVDTETGDVLAAAGAGAGVVSAANWAEVRDFDRTSPARSPLRLPALQHDGGAHLSPGSTFKVISALGLELAARRDPQLDALLDGMPLAAINRLAQQRGFGFQTDAASYPSNPRLAHITNYHEQSLDRRAQAGRLGLAQALTYSLNTWFAWSAELSDLSLFGRAEGGAPDLQALDAAALDPVRPIVAAAHRLGFEQSLRLDGGLLPADFGWRPWDALQATAAHIDPIHTRHELRQMAIGLRMQVTPLQMALASAAIGQGRVVAPRLLLTLGSRTSVVATAAPLGIRLDRIRAGMKGVVDVGTGAGAFGALALAGVRPGLYGKTGTAPTGADTATVWFTGWLEPNSLPGQQHRLALAAFVSHSHATGGEHAAPVLAALLSTLAVQKREQRGK